MEAFQREVGQAAAKLESAKTELKDFQSRVYTLSEVRSLSFFTVSDVLLMCLSAHLMQALQTEKTEHRRTKTELEEEVADVLVANGDLSKQLVRVKMLRQ